MNLNMAQCDYLTLTTFEHGNEIQSAITGAFPKSLGKETKISGYKGVQWPGLFYGTGRQRDRAHFMMRASGEDAHTFLYRTADIKAKCTRIDVQITILSPKGYDARTLYDTLCSQDIEWPGRRLIPEIRQSGDGLDTVYIGSRTSDRFCRVYLKPDRNGKPAYLRFEMEYKGIVSEKVRDVLTKDFGTAKQVLRAELNRLPYFASRALRAFEQVLGAKPHEITPERVEGQNKTLDWLEKQVEPAIVRMLHSHECGDRMREILQRWQRLSSGSGDAHF